MKQLIVETGLSLIVVLAIVLILTGGQGWVIQGPEQQSIDEKSTPRSTQPEMLLVSMTIYKDRDPSIDELAILPQGRASMPGDGENKIELLDEQDQVIYLFWFPADFLSSAHGAEESTEAASTYIIPYDERAVRIAVTTPAGPTIQVAPVVDEPVPVDVADDRGGGVGGVRADAARPGC